MARKLKSDKVLFLATLLLVCASVVMVYSASAVLAMQRYNQPYLFLIKQGMWAALGLAAMSVAMRFDYRNYREPSFIWMSLGVVGLALVAVLFSAPINGSSRWFGIGGIGVQPSELAKLSAIFFMAAILERRMDRVDEAYALVPIALVVAMLVGLILAEPDMGTAITLLIIAAAMVFAAGLNYRYVVGVILCSVPVVYVVLMSASYRRRRLMAFWNPWIDPPGDGFRIIQSLIAVGAGGVMGRGGGIVGLRGLVARRDCGRRHGRPSVPRARRGAGAEGAGAGGADFVCRNGGGHRGARRPAGRIRARPDSQRRAQRKIGRGLSARVRVAASERGRCLARDYAAQTACGDWRGR